MAPPRPRLLYSAVFVWISFTGGRFVAPFLEHEAHFSDSAVGSTLATQVAVACALGSTGGSWADARERRFPGKGRAHVIFIGVSIGSLLFLLQGTHHLFPETALFSSLGWHVTLRILYACCSALVYPVLEGLTLAHLEKTPGMHRSDYGKERLHGAIWWAIANLFAGVLIDQVGFTILYGLTIVSAMATFLCIAVYVNGQGCAGTHKADQDSDTFVDDEIGKQPTDYQDAVPDVKMWTLVRVILGTWYGVAFLFAFACLSAGTSVVESLVFLFFEFLGGSNTMCGITVALTVMFEIPIFHIAPTLLRRLGSGALQQIACVSYLVRVVGYSVIPQGHMAYVLLLEPLHGVTYACSQTSAVDFVAELMPKGYEASGQGLLSLFRGFGSVAGLFLGGFVEDTLGPRIMYRMFAGIVWVGMVVFSMTHFCKPQTPHLEMLPQSDLDSSAHDSLDTATTTDDSSDVAEVQMA